MRTNRGRRSGGLRVLALLSLLALTGCDGATPADGCDGLAEGAGRCEGADIYATCMGGEIARRACTDGRTCAAASCGCDLAMDGTCPMGCPSDPDCASCTPMCDGLSCGPDGCAGTCGTCASGEACVRGTCMDTGGACSDTCEFAGDGECDDGGPGSDFSVCALGTDCSDCGPRDGTGTDAGPVTGTDAGPVTGTDAGPIATDAGPVATDAGPPSCSLTCTGGRQCVSGDERGECCVLPARFEVSVGDDCGSGCVSGGVTVERDDLDPSAIAPFSAGAYCTYDDFFDNLAVSWSNGGSMTGVFGIGEFRDGSSETWQLSDFRVTLTGVGSRADGTYRHDTVDASCTAEHIGYMPSGCGTDENTFGLSIFVDCLATLGSDTLRFNGEIGCTGFEVPTTYP